MVIALMMEAVQTYETLANSYPSIRRYNPEDSHIYGYFLLMLVARIYNNHLLMRRIHALDNNDSNNFCKQM
jgi:hypothetical protein